MSQNSNGFLHVSLSLSICLEAMWCIWMAWGVCPCAGSFGESELHAWCIRWTGLSQNSNGFLHVSLSLRCIWMAWGVCPCAGSFGESELHGVSMLGAFGGQV